MGYFIKIIFERVWSSFMDKRKLIGWDRGQVFGCGSGFARLYRAITLTTKQPNLKLKTRPKQLLGYLLLAFAASLPSTSLDKNIL